MSFRLFLHCAGFLSRNLIYSITGYIEKDAETGLYVAVVPGIPGAHTQAETLDELQTNLKEVVELCLEQMAPEVRKQIPEFVGNADLAEKKKEL